MEELDLEEIFFIPAAQAPLRVNSLTSLSALHRKAMLVVLSERNLTIIC